MPKPKVKSTHPQKTTSRKPKGKPKGKRRGGDPIRRVATDMVNDAYRPALRQGRMDVADAKAQHKVVDAGYDKAGANLRGAQAGVTQMDQVLRASGEQAANQGAGFVSAEGQQLATQLGADAALLGRSAGAAQVPLEVALAAGSALKTAGGINTDFNSAMAAAHVARSANQLLASEALRGEAHQATNREISQRKGRVLDLKSQRSGDVAKTTVDLHDQRAKQQLAAAELGLDTRKQDFTEASFWAELAEKGKSRRSQRRTQKEQNAIDAAKAQPTATDAWDQADMDGDGIPNARDKDVDGNGKPDAPSTKTTGADELAGAQEFNGYYDKPNGRATHRYVAGPRARKIYVTPSEYRSAVSTRRRVLSWGTRARSGNEKSIKDPIQRSIGLAIARKRKLSRGQKEYLRTMFPGGHFPYDLARALEMGDYSKLKG